MVRSTRLGSGFTLTELLIVVAILAVFSAILFPVFRTAKAAAHRTVCSSNFRNVGMATQLYLSDYDDRFMLVNHNIAAINDPIKDRTWVQLVMPYLNEFRIFECPGDTGRVRKSGAFDVDLVVGDTYQRFYRDSLSVNVGYNYLYYSPVIRVGNNWQVITRSQSEIADASSAVLFVDSVKTRTPSGAPTGGGSYIVLPPCRYAKNGTQRIDTFNVNNAQVYAPYNGWMVSNSKSPFRYGLAWPWHNEKMNVARVNGGIIAASVTHLSEGCDVRENWSGFINDLGKYAWDGF